MLLLLLGVNGCTRNYYRLFADRQVYGIERQRMIDWRWDLPPRPVEADPRSRIGDPTDPDHYPIPLDEPAARLYQITNGLPWEFAGWRKRGATPVENVDWRKYIPTGDDGAILLTPATSMQIFSMNSRDYQFALENVYLAALTLTQFRFQFALQPFAGYNTLYSHFGAGQGSTNQLTLTTTPPGEGFNLMLMSGAQILTNLANAMVFEWTGKGPVRLVTSNLLITVTQPLLQNAFARIVTQTLSFQERNVLYQIRAFAEQRRAFYVQVEGTQVGFLGLLTQLQSLRNQEALLKQYQRSLEEYNALVSAGLIDPLQRDNIAQQYQLSQLGLLSQQAALQSSLDQFKFLLAIPPNTLVRLDDSLLKLFELNDPRFDDLRTRNDRLYLQLQQYESSPGNEVMADATRKLLADFAELERVATVVSDELRKWQEQIPREPPPGAAGTGNLLLDVLGAPGTTGEAGRASGEISRNEVIASIERQRTLSSKLVSELEKTRAQMADNIASARDLLASLEADKAKEPLKVIGDLVGRAFRGRLAELFVAQIQIRVFMIQLPPIDLTLDQAIQIAVENRLDLMNALASVTDNWRSVEVAANSLRGVLNLNYTANINKVPSHGALLGFDEAATTNQVSVSFQAPLVRRAQRNAYRASQISYQRARRFYMQTYDTILQQIRFDMRELALFRRQFEIGREQLIIATRQVDQAEYNLRNSTGAGSAVGQSAALNLQTALGSLLTAKNSLIANWASYMNQRMTLFRDFDLMNIDAQGVWTNEQDNPATAVAAAGRTVPEPRPRPEPGQPLPPPPDAPGPFTPR